ncbi:MAG: hypothetical protein H6672_09250 [Anaerolineaceae bacterium]|nr:hypothetical protein [Anaerolineaceae bacterium]
MPTVKFLFEGRRPQYGQLTLITCDVAGGYNTHRQDYNQRVVVVATRVDG